MMSRKRTAPGIIINDDRDDESLLRRSPGTKSSRKTPPSLAKIFVRKICFLKAGDDQQGREGIIALLQDIVAGIILGSIGMIILLSLDYAGIVNLETARVLRKTASVVFNAPEMVEGMEEELGMKIVPVDGYNRMQKELSDSQAVMEEEQKIVHARTTKVSSMRAELDPLREEYNKLMKETGLDQFCPDCHWGMGMSCQKRVNFMLEQYSDTATTIGCISNLVREGPSKGGRCLKPS